MIAAVAGGLCAVLAAAAPVPIAVPNASFEENTLSAGQWTYDLEPHWKETGGPRSGSGFMEYIVGFVAEGTDHLGMTPGHDVWQDLGVVYEANTIYRLTVAAGYRSGLTQPGNRSEYHLADPTGTLHATGMMDASSLPEQTFADAPTLVLNTLETPAAVGRTVRILLRARGSGRSHFDALRLTAESFQPPATAIFGPLGAADLTPQGATLTGSIVDIGDGIPDVTVYWGPQNGGTDPTGWAHAAALGPQTGTFQVLVTGLAPGREYFFTARGVNTAGVSWAQPVALFETLAAPPRVDTLRPAAIGAVSAVLGAEVTDNGGETPDVRVYYGVADGGTDPEAWAASIALGRVSGAASAEASGLTPATTYYVRAFAGNSGGPAWSDQTLTFTTLTVHPPAVENRSPTGVTGVAASLRGRVTQTGNDPPEVTIFYGPADGGEDPAGWAEVAAIGQAEGAFARFVTGLTPATTYYYRCRAVNGAGAAWALGSETFDTTAVQAPRAVINEFHYNPGDRTSLEEFIELHNPGDDDLDLSGWSLRNAVAYVFPAGTTLPAAGYCVVAEAPEVMAAKYGVAALGPWTGKLSSRGENIDLHDALGVRRLRVGYRAGFPWPTHADGGGGSVELIHPDLDPDLGGSWRVSGYDLGEAVFEVYIAAGSAGWRYHRGLSEASDPVDAWRGNGYDDGAWLVGAAPFGYHAQGAYTLATTLADMRHAYSTVYYRHAFTVPPDEMPEAIVLRLLYDDGVVVWLNGKEVARRYAPAGHLSHTAVATADHPATAWEEIVLPVTEGVLYGGANVIAVHSLNLTRGSSDYYFDLELRSAHYGGGTAPTPGARNTVYRPADEIPPQIRQVAHTPRQPAPGEPVTITAKITDPDGMGPVTLSYQVVNPGAYIRLTDAAYANTWTSVPMFDDGTEGDEVAGDSFYTAVLPEEVQTNRRLVRYRITFADALGNAETVPYADDEQPNFAYYVYAGVPDWAGAFDPGSTPVQVYPGSLLTQLPVYTLIADGTDVINSQFNSSFNQRRFTGTFVYDGEVFDHIQFRNRGEHSTYVSGKNKWRFYFNRARDLQARNTFGEPYAETWGQFSGEGCSSPWAAVHRGMAGVEEAVSYRIYELAGVPSPHTHYYHFRVVRGATETPPVGQTVNDLIGNTDGQYAGDFWGLYLAVEPIRGPFLRVRGLPSGNVYKIEGNNGDKKHQGVDQPLDSSDWNAFRNAHVSPNPTQAWWEANLDLPNYYTFHALNRLVGNVDLRGGANHFFYHRPTDNRWVVIPWDQDMMFIAKSHWTTSINGVSYPGVIHAHKALLQHPALALGFRNRGREILDLMASDTSPTGGQIGQLIREFAGIIHPDGATVTWANADAAMWNLHPRTRGSVGTRSGQTNHRGNFFWTPFADSRMGGGWNRWLRTPSFSGHAAHEDFMAYLLDYATDAWPGGTWLVNNGNQLGYGYQYLKAETADPDIPHRPTVTYTGREGYPVNELFFASSAFADPQGTHTHAATAWRIAEIGPRAYEIQAIWTSGALPGPPGEITVPDGIARPDRTYRVRVRHQDTTGRWSHWSVPVEFNAGPRTAAPLLHYWNFNLADPALEPTRSYDPGAALVPTLTGSAAIDFGTGQDFSALNARDGDPAGAHLRVNDPVDATLEIALPTPGFKDIVVQYETRRSGQGAGTQKISYTLNGTDYLALTAVAVLDAVPELVTLDFTDIAGVANNPAFALRIEFAPGTGGAAGNNRFDNLTVEGLPSVADAVARLLPRGDAAWDPPSNWTTARRPDGAGTEAWIGAPATGDRTVTLARPLTLGALVFDHDNAPDRNQLAGPALTFDGAGEPALLRVRDAGEAGGFAELDVDAVTLATDLRLQVDHPRGHAEHGGLRLRRTWTGSGGLIKLGPGLATLTGEGKTFTGAITIEQGALGVTEPAAPTQTVGVAVLAGGQLRLTSGSSGVEPRVYTFGGGAISIAGPGRGGAVPPGEQFGILGALRYEPYADADHHAVLVNPLILDAAAGVHVAGGANRLDLLGTLIGAQALTKTGGGRLGLLAAAHPSFAGTLEILNGTVAIGGDLPAPVTLAEGAVIEGHGRVGTVFGLGTVELDKTALTAESMAVARCSFVLGRVGGPAPTIPAAAGNSVLRLTATDPLPGAVPELDFYLDIGALATGDRLGGGLFVGAGVPLAELLGGTAVRIHVRDPAGPVLYRGQSYRAAGPEITWAVAEATLDFGEGPVAGRLMELRVGSGLESYAQWRTLMFPDPADRDDDTVSGPGASAAGDGVANFVRYAMGLGPYDSTAGHSPHLAGVEGQLQFRYRINANLPDVAWRVRATVDLGRWTHTVYERAGPTEPLPETDGIWFYHVPPFTPGGLEEPDTGMFLRLELWPVE